MSLSIRQRCQKVAECIQSKRKQGLQAIAKATGLTIVLCLSSFLWPLPAVIITQSRGGGKPG